MISIVVFLIIGGTVLWLVTLMLAQKAVTSVQSLIQKGDYSSAVREADSSLLKNPDDAATHLHRAEALKLTGDFEAALASYRRAMSLRRDDAAAREGVALTLTWLGRDAETARRLMEETLQQFPQILEFQSLSLAWILLRQGRRNEALRLYDDNRDLLQTRFEMDYTDRDPLLAETLFHYAALAEESGDGERAVLLRRTIDQFAPSSVFAEGGAALRSAGFSI